MITDKLLTFAEGKEISGQSVTSDVIDFGKTYDEIARTFNVVAQLDDCKNVTPTDASIVATMNVTADDGATHSISFPEVTVAECIAGKRLINFAKMPLGMMGGKMQITLTLSKAISGAKWSAYLTQSCEA